METNTNALKSQRDNPAAEVQQRDYLAVGEAADQRIFRKAEAASMGTLEWLITVTSGGQTYADLPPVKLAAFDELKDLAVRLSLLGLRVQRDGPTSVEPEYEQTLDEIIRLLAVLNSPDMEDDPA
ncbi:hypothetical protein [Pontibacter kalidii]|uniref:hypothetical protein n=1 Tax=Pontibacter kalidii TaxID=2592049 RepID=UPI00224E3DCD|nr:hypothetical protein [Pontibacter kalidii]